MIPVLFIVDDAQARGPAGLTVHELATALDPGRFTPLIAVLEPASLPGGPSAVEAISIPSRGPVAVARLGALMRSRGTRLVVTSGRRADQLGPVAGALAGAAALSLRSSGTVAGLQRQIDRLVAGIATGSREDQGRMADEQGVPRDRIRVIDGATPGSGGAVRRYETFFDEALAEIGAAGPERIAPSRRVAKAAIAGAYLAARPLFSLARGRGAWICLCYHRVLPELGATDPWLVVGTETFRRQLESIGRHYQFVTALDLSRALASGGPRRPMCAITFDDGYEDNLLHGLPVLARMGAPASIYVSTDAVSGGGALWFERVGSAVAAVQARGRRSELAAAARALLDVEVNLLADVATITRDLCAALKDLPTSQRRETIAALEQRVGAASADELPRYLDWDGVRDLERAGWEIGSHTRTHPILPQTPDAEALDEIARSRSDLARELQAPPPGFAYPNGDCDDRIVGLVRQAGYEYAVVATPDQGRAGDPYRISRRCISDHSSRGYAHAFSQGAFLAEVEGALDRLR